MKRVLIVSPSFPPISAADLHRIRTSVPFFATFGWHPVVLAIRPDAHGGLVEPELESTVPAGLSITRTGALPPWLTRPFGIGNAGLRALGHLYVAGAALIKREAIDVVYFSTTMFPVMALGRLWKSRFGTPYVIDMQDPWKSEYQGAGRQNTAKARLARLMHGGLEPFAMRRVDAVIAVSAAYTETLRRRYPWIREDMCATIPFGASESDAEAARAILWHNPFFDSADGRTHGVAVGRGGADMAPAARLLFRAMRLVEERGGTQRLRLSFVGTSYTEGSQATATIRPVAEAAGISADVREFPARVPYLQALRLLDDAHFTMILGSDDPAYSPSKVYPYLLARKPFVAVLHAASPVVPLLRQAGTGVVATFGAIEGPANLDQDAASLARDLEHLLGALPAEAAAPSWLLEPVSSRELARQQSLVFDAAIRHASAEGVPCPE